MFAVFALGGILGLAPRAVADDAPVDAPAEEAPVVNEGPAVSEAPASEEASESAVAAPSETLARAQRIENALIGVLDRVSSSSVTVLARQRVTGARSDGVSQLSGAGSGVVIRYGGLYVLTNAHVVADPGAYIIKTQAREEYAVQVLATDTGKDLALMRFTEGSPAVEAADLTQSYGDILEEGAWVFATGNPFLLAIHGPSAATLGVYSGARRGRRGSADYMLQHDAEINPGSSGGPLWDLDGRLLGINGAIVTRSQRAGAGPSHTGTSISIPISQIRTFLDGALGRRATATPTVSRPVQPVVRAPRPAPPTARPPAIIQDGPAPAPVVPVARSGGMARFGLRGATSLTMSGTRNGVLVHRVASGSPFSPQVGSGDRIINVYIDGVLRPVRSLKTLDTALGEVASGSSLRLTYIRRGTRYTWSGLVP